MTQQYGVVPEGFRRKPLDRIIFELETSARTIFGSDVILDPESPMGQFVGLMALLISQTWEIGENAYQSYDPDQAEGARLDMLGRIRVLQRAAGEGDAQFRRAITNQDRARHDVQDLARAVRGLDGVTYTQVFVNETNQVDENNLAPGALAIAVLGGDDQEIATEARRYIVPGVITQGNQYVTTEIDGLCRTVAIVRPILVPVTLTINVRLRHDRLGCPPPSTIAVRDGFVEDLSEGSRRLLNGDDITLWRVRSAIEARHPQMVEVLSMTASRDEGNITSTSRLNIGFIEMATLDPNDVTINTVS